MFLLYVSYSFVFVPDAIKKLRPAASAAGLSLSLSLVLSSQDLHTSSHTCEIIIPQAPPPKLISVIELHIVCLVRLYDAKVSIPAKTANFFQLFLPINSFLYDKWVLSPGRMNRGGLIFGVISRTCGKLHVICRDPVCIYHGLFVFRERSFRTP